MKDGEENGALPEGWTARCIGQVLNACYGKALPRKARRGGRIAVYGSNGPVGAHDEAITAAPVIVIGRKGSVGAINFSEKPVWPIDTTYFIDEFSAFDPEFLRSLLLWVGLDQMDRSTAIPGLSRKQLYELRAVIPPFAEQRRIAAQLSEIESRRGLISTHLQTARTVLERLRNAVLAAACSGRLTEDWRNAHPDMTSDEFHAELVKMRHDARFRQAVPSNEHGLTSETQLESLPSTWGLVRLGDILDVGTGATPLRKNRAYYDNGTIPWVTSGAVNAGTITSPAEMITRRALEETNVKLFPPGTLLVAMYGEGQTRGRVAELAIEAGTNQAVAAVLFTEATAPIRPFTRLFFEDSYRRVRALSVGGVQPNLNLGMIKDTFLPLPPREEQDEIVRRATVALETVDRLTAQLAQSQETVDSISRASLVKAFRGELVPTEASLAAEEGRDFESGEELLRRVMPDNGDRSENGLRW